MLARGLYVPMDVALDILAARHRGGGRFRDIEEGLELAGVPVHLHDIVRDRGPVLEE